MRENLLRVALAPEVDQGRQDREGDGRDGKELEEARVHRGEERADGIDGAHVQQAEDGTEHERSEPQDELLVGFFHLRSWISRRQS